MLHFHRQLPPIPAFCYMDLYSIQHGAASRIAGGHVLFCHQHSYDMANAGASSSGLWWLMLREIAPARARCNRTSVDGWAPQVQGQGMPGAASVELIQSTRAL